MDRENSRTPVSAYYMKNHIRKPGLIFLCFCRLIVFLQNLRIRTVELFLRQHTEKLPADIQRLFNRTVFIRALAYKMSLKRFTELQILLVNDGPLS